jgi:hypothetical protein
MPGTGISRLTAHEIFSNPFDLEFTLWKDETGGEKFAFAVFRGEEHRYRTIVSTDPFAEDPEAALAALKGLLEPVLTVCEKELEDPGSMLSQFVNPKGRPPRELEVLNSALIDRILADLRENRCASTCEMRAPAA